jgi:PiT family inorganic phosphate transporter
VSPELALALSLALVYSLTNGFHDAANSIATLVATRAARPLPAALLAAVFTMAGPLLVGAAVADTIAGIVTVESRPAVGIVGAGLAGAVAWNLLTWRVGLPSSSGHALVGGLVGAALADAGPDAVRWGGVDGWRPAGVLGVLAALAVAPILGGVAGLAAVKLARRGLRRARREVGRAVKRGEWIMSAGLAFSFGANDAQKAVGVIAVLLLASGHTDELSAPLWVLLAAGGALTLGTALGGWAIVRTIGRRIYRLRPLDGLASQTGSAGVILASSFAGAPVSTTHVVASSVVGVGGGRGRWRRVDWEVVREMGLAWIATMPAAALLAALILLVWRAIQ